MSMFLQSIVLPLLGLVCLVDILCISGYALYLQNVVDCNCDQCLQRHTTAPIYALNTVVTDLSAFIMCRANDTCCVEINAVPIFN